MVFDVLLTPKRVFDFLRDQLHTHKDVKHQHHHRHSPPSESRHKAQRERHHIQEDELLHEHAVAVRNGGLENALTGTEDVDHALEVLTDQPMLLGCPLARDETLHGFTLHGLRPCIGRVVCRHKGRALGSQRLLGLGWAQMVSQRLHKARDVGSKEIRRGLIRAEFAYAEGEGA